MQFNRTYNTRRLCHRLLGGMTGPVLSWSDPNAMSKDSSYLNHEYTERPFTHMCIIHAGGDVELHGNEMSALLIRVVRLLIHAIPAFAIFHVSVADFWPSLF
ncbi:hypothetical protein BCR43DRAFT_489567 [Syncephalastrum racemosum]|uniref:Uncharacterized protein n=1 Tax=Syncephalastrum racemosum TaxID=13706 RepID=A0A1X2HEG6_SYNRA|nr:hypothetical protein BCR43DRAFT_489567 [Syncephalastrum racemosum]